MRLVALENFFFIGGKCRNLHICRTRFDNQIRFLKTIVWNSYIEVEINSFPFCKASVKNKNLGNVSYIGKFKDRRRQKSQKFWSFPETQTFCSTKFLIAFHPSSISRYFATHRTLLPSDTMCLIPWNRNLMDRTRPRLSVGMTPFDKQTRFSSAELSGFFSSRSQSTLLFLYRMNWYV